MSARKLILVAALVCAGTAQAQTAGVVNLRANQTSAQGSLVPVLTWSTSPTAQSCRASGGWSGTKAVSGTQTLPSINASTNYTLTCTWSGGNAVVSWTAPTTNTNGSTLTNLAGFRVLYGTSSGSLNQVLTVSDSTARSATVQALTPGTWYFAVRAVNSLQAQSDNSNVAQKAVTGATAASTVGITISATPPPPPPPPPPPTTGPPPLPNPVAVPGLRTTATAVYDIVPSGNSWVLGRQVGTIALRQQCLGPFRIGNRYRVWRGQVRFTRQTRSDAVVVSCAIS